MHANLLWPISLNILMVLMHPFSNNWGTEMPDTKIWNLTSQRTNLNIILGQLQNFTLFHNSLWIPSSFFLFLVIPRNLKFLVHSHTIYHPFPPLEKRRDIVIGILSWVQISWLLSHQECYILFWSECWAEFNYLGCLVISLEILIGIIYSSSDD